MPETIERKPLLQDSLTQVQRVMLGQTYHSPGFTVVIKLIEGMCDDALAYTTKLDPEEEGYERKLAVRTQRARNINEAAAILRDSIKYHLEMIVKQDADENQAAEESVNKAIGIHSAVAGQPIDAIQKTFGIHPAKPKKKETVKEVK
jgi:hypothetical protein